MHDFQGYFSTTLSFNYQDFQGPKLFPQLYTSWNLQEKIKEFTRHFRKRGNRG